MRILYLLYWLVSGSCEIEIHDAAILTFTELFIDMFVAHDPTMQSLKGSGVEY